MLAFSAPPQERAQIVGRTRTLKAKKGLTGRHVIIGLQTVFRGVKDLAEHFDILVIALANSSQKPVAAVVAFRGTREPVSGQLTKGNEPGILTFTTEDQGTAQLFVQGQELIGRFG